MPHIIIKAWPGKTDSQKQQLAAAITRDVMNIFYRLASDVRRAGKSHAP